MSAERCSLCGEMMDKPGHPYCPRGHSLAAPSGSVISLGDFKGLLVRHGLVDTCAFDDSEGYDGGRTAQNALYAWKELCVYCSPNDKLSD